MQASYYVVSNKSVFDLNNVSMIKKINMYVPMIKKN